MASLVPEDLTRLQAVVFVDNTELSVINREEIIRTAAKNLAEQALRKLLKDCIETVGDYLGHSGQTLRLDAYVLSPHQLHKIIMQAREEGVRDWQVFNRYI